jgi:hypothetical protein
MASVVPSNVRLHLHSIEKLEASISLSTGYVEMVKTLPASLSGSRGLGQAPGTVSASSLAAPEATTRDTSTRPHGLSSSGVALSTTLGRSVVDSRLPSRLSHARPVASISAFGVLEHVNYVEHSQLCIAPSGVNPCGQDGLVNGATAVAGSQPGLDSVVWSTIGMSLLFATFQDVSNRLRLQTKSAHGSKGLHRLSSLFLLGVLFVLVTGFQTLSASKTSATANHEQVAFVDEARRFLCAVSGMILAAATCAAVPWKTSAPHSWGGVWSGASRLSDAVASKAVVGLQSGFRRFVGGISDVRCRVLRRLDSPRPQRNRRMRVPLGRSG